MNSSPTINSPLRLIATSSSSALLLLFAVPACDAEDQQGEQENHQAEAEQVQGDPPGLDELDSWEQKTAEFAADRLENDFNNDGFADLVIGVPNDNFEVADGAIHVLYGSEDGLTTEGSFFAQGGGSPGEQFGAALAAGDFNDDGFADLAIGAPFANVNGQNAAGYVLVLFGSEDGLTGNDSQIWHQDIEDIEPIEDAAEPNDNFGSSLITGDFNDDGSDDLAVGVPGEDIGATVDAGAAHVLFGSTTGLLTTGEQFLHEDVAGLSDTAEANDRFGAALSAGYFNGDDFEDLVIGVPGESGASGLVYAIYGESAGLYLGDPITDPPPAPQIWHQNSAGIENSSEAGDEFGSALTAGDFNGDGVDDLAVGVPGESVGPDASVGAANTIYGSDAGLTATGDQYWHQDSPGILDDAEEGDRFGEALVAGDFNADGYDDLAVGSPSEDLANIIDAGGINALYGGDTGLSATGDQRWHQNVAGIQGVSESSDFFASALSIGDFDGDDDADLAVGVPFEDVGAVVDAGEVDVLYGDVNDGLTANDQVWNQPIAGDPAQPGDNFGAAVR